MDYTVSNVNNLGKNFVKPPTTASERATVDYDAFLNLLVAQLKNQDPTEPTDPGQLMAQLASFSSVEQQIQTNSKLDSLVQSNVLGQASSLIGKTATSFDGASTGVIISITLLDGEVTALLSDGSNIAINNGVVISQ